MVNGIDLTVPIISIAVGLVVSTIILFLGRHFLSLDKTKTDATSSVFTTTMIQGNLEDYKNHTDKKIDDLTKKIERALDRLATHDTDIKLHELRLGYLDKNSNKNIKKEANNRNGDFEH